MRTYKTIAAALILLTVPALGQPATEGKADTEGYFCRAESYRTMDFAKVTRNYERCLSSDNDGIVESALAYIAETRLVLPAADLTGIRETVEKLTISDRAPFIRYKAYLASMVLASPGLFSQTVERTYADSNEFFAAIDAQLRHSLLGFRGE
jgi:hypothetical protein